MTRLTFPRRQFAELLIALDTSLDTSRLLAPDDAADYLGITVEQLAKLRRRRLVGFVRLPAAERGKVGRTIRYSVKDLNTLVADAVTSLLNGSAQ